MSLNDLLNEIMNKDFVKRRLSSGLDFRKVLEIVGLKSIRLLKNFYGASSVDNNLNFLLELNIAYWLILHNIDFQYEPLSLGKRVDFFVPNFRGKRIAIEVKNINVIKAHQNELDAIESGKNFICRAPDPDCVYVFPEGVEPKRQTKINYSLSVVAKKCSDGVQNYRYSKVGKDGIEARYKDSIIESIIKTEEKLSTLKYDQAVLLWGCDFGVIDFAEIYFRDVASFYWDFFRSGDQFKMDYAKWLFNKHLKFLKNIDYFALINRPGRSVSPLLLDFSKSFCSLFKADAKVVTKNFLQFSKE